VSEAAPEVSGSLPQPRRLAGRTRLALALTTSGIVLGAFQQGALSFLPFAVVASTPLLLAVRCLPLPIGLAVAFVAGVVARLISARGMLGDDLALACVASSALWLVPFLVDRVSATWLRRVGFLAFPCAAVLLGHAGDVLLSPAVASQLHMPAHHRVLDMWTHDVGRAVVDWSLFAIASAISGLASVHNWFVRDPYPFPQREAGLRFGGIVGFWIFFVVCFVGWYRIRHGASSDVTQAPAPGPVLIACAIGAVACVIAALLVRSRMRASAAP
jgi:hypothetical protein